MKILSFAQSRCLLAAIALLTATGISSGAEGAIMTVGVYDENASNADTVDTVAPGSTLTLQQTKDRAAAAFAADTGGVWNFDTAVSGEFDGTHRDSFTLSYGQSQSNTLTLSIVGNSYNQSGSFAISGGNTLGASQGQGDGTFTPSESLTMIAVTLADRGQATRTMRLIANYEDGSTLSTTPTASNIDSLHVLTATNDNPITSFTFDVNAYVIFDDFAFEVVSDESSVVPEPAAFTLLAIGAGVLLAGRSFRPNAEHGI